MIHKLIVFGCVQVVVMECNGLADLHPSRLCVDCRQKKCVGHAGALQVTCRVECIFTVRMYSTIEHGGMRKF